MQCSRYSTRYLEDQCKGPEAPNGIAMRAAGCGGEATGLCRAREGCPVYPELSESPGGLEIVWRLQF